MTYKVALISLGCAKNQVDCERMMYRVQEAGHAVKADIVGSDVVVINTCGFIGDAKEESINMILNFCQAKKARKIKRLYVMRCLSQRYAPELIEEIPEVDGFFGKFDWEKIVAEVGGEYNEALANSRELTTPSHYAYLKISEGCNRTCAYCAIPIITGRHQSRPMEEILDEVRLLVASGVKEFQVIAQELTFYGVDLYKERRIAQLVQAMADIPGVEWIRLHYAYPTDFPMELLDVMQNNANVCKYLDIALQHVSDNILGAMHRHTTKEETYRLIEAIRSKVPGIHLRTTLMVGFPSETDHDFDELCEFVRWARFERMGAFAYSEEAGTPSAELYTDDISDELKQERLSRLMRLQQRISLEIQEEKVGKVFPVIIDRIEGDWYVGRTEYDSPEVDPEVLLPVSSASLQLGNIYQVRIERADDFDLYGEIA